MKKALWIAVLLISPLLQAQQKSDEALKKFYQVETPAPVPAKMKAGWESISGKDLKALLTFLSSDLLEGRETATRGYAIAAEYVGSLFGQWGIKPAGDNRRVSPRFSGMPGPGERREPALEKTYYQEFEMKELVESDTHISLETKKENLLKSTGFEQNVDFTYRSTASESLSAPVVFAGFGISEKAAGYDDYKNLDVRGKIVMLLTDAPGRDNPNSPFQKGDLKAKYFAPPMMMRRGGGFNKSAEAEKQGAVAVLLVRNPLDKSGDIQKDLLPPPVDDSRPIIPPDRRRLMLLQPSERMPWESLPVARICREMADTILAGNGLKLADISSRIETTLKPFSFELPSTRLTIENKVKTALAKDMNVLGVVEGSDPNLKNEVVVIGAHMDHLGKRGDYIFNGADDNGSGSVGVMVMARAFALNPEKPKRSLLFALWTGEEKGLLGSRYYAQNPVYPIKNTVAYINLDMVSQPWNEKSLASAAAMLGLEIQGEMMKKIKPDNFFGVMLAADRPDLIKAIKDADQFTGLSLYLNESKTAGGGSDHASFAAVKVPWAFYNVDSSEDYHRPSDSVEKINPAFMERINRWIYLTAYLLADK